MFEQAMICLIVGVIYFGLAIVTCFLGNYLRDRTKSENARIWILAVTIFVAAVLLIFAIFSFYEVAERISRPPPKFKMLRMLEI